MPNHDTGDGCTVLDLVDLTRTTGGFLRSVKDVADALYADGVITRFERRT